MHCISLFMEQTYLLRRSTKKKKNKLEAINKKVNRCKASFIKLISNNQMQRVVNIKSS